jgi:hypothetical protein
VSDACGLHGTRQVRGAGDVDVAGGPGVGGAVDHPIDAGDGSREAVGVSEVPSAYVDVRGGHDPRGVAAQDADLVAGPDEPCHDGSSEETRSSWYQDLHEVRPSIAEPVSVMPQ